ncbi:sensor histidine kinase [Clostridium vincentii]|uniref:histidine kinase n=1 Tax=Clostridium vincentii TaxID=52704 RepID=A0A2T0BI58_9CLOT|nr:HAMP domain-containing sensor histidine kinase [Clostridium vincentii]PRR83568.1 Sensor histidine kinase YycG [Clostridium vincentii]
MGIKLKSRVKDYLNHIWLLEIIGLLFIISYFSVEVYKYYSTDSSKMINIFRSTINPQKYYEENLAKDSLAITNMIYQKTNSLEKIYYGNDIIKEAFKRDFIDKVYEKEEFELNENIFFIIRNKNTNQIITNDSSGYFELSDGKYTDENILSYVNEKYEGKELLVSYDNENKFSTIVEEDYVIYDKSVLANFQEYYFTSRDNYVENVYFKIVFGLYFLIVLGIFLISKVVGVIIISRNGSNIRGNFVISIIYVLKNGFKYRQTRKTLIGTIICSIIFFIFYLYMLAVGGIKNNILVTFFTLYPFKGSIILMTLPMIGIIYSIKKSVDIYLVNDSLKRINEGDLDYHIVEQGGIEILELITNINKIKEGYEIAVQDTLKNEKVKTELISNVSHDLRTPLTSIINYVNILKSEDITEEEKQDYLKIVDQKSKKLKVLIDDLFEMSKINSGKMVLSKEKIDIMSLIHQAVGEYSSLYEDKEMEFKVNSIVEELYIELDGKMMSRAIENIVINALKYSLENTRVYIDIMDEGESIGISIKNIANYEMNFNNEEIFERFARGDESRNSNVEGSGLGLAITKSIIELHEGNITINTEGDMFKIYINLPK